MPVGGESLQRERGDAPHQPEIDRIRGRFSRVQRKAAPRSEASAPVGA
jgi:hypothetical protein